MKKDCIFCEIANDKAHSWTIYEDEQIKAFFDINPGSKGHTLVIPKQHYANIYDLPEDLASKIFVFAKKLAIFYKEYFKTENVNIITSTGSIAGQEVFHFHLHVIPRYKDDGFNFTHIPDYEINKKFDKYCVEISDGFKKFI